MTANDNEFTNWVDPDILAEYDGIDIGFDRELEEGFKEFFETGWLDPKYNDLRERYDPLLQDEDPNGRLYGKITLWSVVRLRAMQSGTPFKLDRPKAYDIERAKEIEAAATELFIAVWRGLNSGIIPDRTAIDDAALRLRDKLNPDPLGNSNWLPGRLAREFQDPS
ncbi:MAG TPA: hypothetical protein VIH90_08400 [Candidatus Saccharimonadales bacterium]